MTQDQDKLSCHGMTFECEVGFHDIELKKKQVITLEYDAFVRPIEKANKDQIENIRLDYYKAQKLLDGFFKSQKFNLIETIATDAADLLMKNFDVESITVHVSKSPIDIPIPSVTYSCKKSKN